MESKTRTRNSIINVLYTSANQIVSIFLMFISRNVFINYLGIELLGVNSLFSNVLGLLSFVDLGLNSVMAFSFYKPLAENNKKFIAALLYFYKRIYYIIGLVIFLLGVALMPFLHKIVSLDAPVDNLELYFLISLITVSSSYLFVFKTTLLIADQKGFIYTRISMLSFIIKSILQILIMMTLGSFCLYLILELLSNLFMNIYSSHITDEIFPYLKDKSYILDKEEKNTIIKNIYSGAIGRIAEVLMTSTDNIIISIYVGTVAVGYCSNYFLIQSKITGFIFLAFSSIVSSVANLIVTEKSKERYKIFNLIQNLAGLISVLSVPLYILLVSDFIFLWLGDKYVLGNSVVYAIGLNMFLAIVLNPLYTFRSATGLYMKTKYLMIICAILNIILSIVLSYYIGICGVIIASALSRILTYVIVEPFLLYKRYFNISCLPYFVTLFKEFIVVFSISFLLNFTINKYFEVVTWNFWIAKLLVVLIVLLLIAYILYRNTDISNYIKSHFLKVFE